MAPPLNAAQHILIETLLKEGFETKLIASEASCSRDVNGNSSLASYLIKSWFPIDDGICRLLRSGSDALTIND